MFPEAARRPQLLPGQVESPESDDRPKRGVWIKDNRQPGANNAADEGEALRSALLAAGVSPELVSQVLASYTSDKQGAGVSHPPVLSTRPDPKQLADTSKASLSMPEADFTPDSLNGVNAGNHEQLKCEPTSQVTSPFDLIMEKFVGRKQEENALLERIISTINDVEAVTLEEDKDQVAGGSSDQVVAYSFGDFFDRCVRQRGDPDVRVRAIELAHQYALVIKETSGEMATFEGCVALICQSLDHPTDPRVFRASCQLASTLFEAMDGPVESAKKTTLGIVAELPREHWLPGLTSLLGAFLANDCCWSATTGRSGKQARLSQSKTVNRYFLQWVRLLVQQRATQRAFLLVCSSTDDLRLDPVNNSTGNRLPTALYTCAANKLRLLRLLLSSTVVERIAFFDDVREGIADCCRAIGRMARHIESATVATTLQRLSGECLQLLDGRHNSSTTTPKTAVYVHNPLFRTHPPSSSAVDRFSSLLRRYYDARPRPPALYRHHFERSNVVDTDASVTTSVAKGNIRFVGVIEARDASQFAKSFHDQVAEQTRPFVFEAPASHATREDGQSPSATTVESPFSVFRGTMERRGVEIPPPSSRLPDFGGRSNPTRRKSRVESVATAAATSRASPSPPAEASDCLPVLVTRTSVPGTGPIDRTPSRRLSKPELPRKPSTAQVTGGATSPTQTLQAPPQIASAERKPGSPDKDACCVQ